MTPETPMCGGCGMPIEADASGARKYLAMMDLNGGPADRVHASEDCKVRYKIKQLQKRVKADQDAIARLEQQSRQLKK